MARKDRPKIRKAVDFTLFLSIILLVIIGIIMVFSASWPEAMKNYNNGYHFLRKQLFSALIGLVGMIIVMNIDYRNYEKLAFPIYIISIILGLLVFTSLGSEAKGARRWLDLGFIMFMPSDVIKFASILFFAKFLSTKREDISTLVQGTLPAFIYIGISVGVIIIEDLGTGVTLATTMMIMFFIAGLNMKHIIPIIAGGSAALWYIIAGAPNSYRITRITSFRDPFADKLGAGWQAVQSLYALGSGGLFGLGLGKSRQKFFYLSEAYNDFIFSIIGEELGFFGAMIIILLFAIVIWRGIIIALKTEDEFACFLASGITALITVQSLIHIAVVTSSIPTTGITLPFISYGGTSLIIYMVSIGILLNISRHTGLDRS